MKAIVLREIHSFFGSPIAYMVIAVFLICNGLFLWVFDGDYNILNSGYADLGPFFTIAPWLLLFLIPAVTMRSFSEEIKQGTLELLLTKPLSVPKIVVGKFLGAFILIVISIVPTLLYVSILNNLGLENASVDIGSTLGSYFGLLFLISAYCAIGVFCSVITENQIIAFLTGVLLCFFFYYGFNGIATIATSLAEFIAIFGMQEHFKSMSKGVLDTRDVCYFLSISFLFIGLTVYKLKSLQQ